MKIRTVRGDIAPEALGFTSMHEHTMLDLSIASEFMKNILPPIPEQMLKFVPQNYGFLKTGVYLLSEELKVVDDFDYLTSELGYFKALGGNAICDCSPIGVRIHIEKIRELSEKTGLHIICATGIYTEISRPQELMGKDADYLYGIFKNEVEHGIDGTDIKPGILKCALATCTQDGITPGEIAGLQACAKLSAETGMSVHIHTDPMVDRKLILEAVDHAIQNQGVHPERILVCHMDNRIANSVPVENYLKTPGLDRTLNLDLQKALLDRGINIGLDTWGMPVSNPQYFMPDDMERLKALITLLDLGYSKQITLGDDFSCKIQGRTYGSYGCTRFTEFALPMLEQMGYKEQILHLTVENPARILAF